MGIGDWGLGIGPNPQSPNPQSPIPNNNIYLILIYSIFNFYNNIFVIILSFSHAYFINEKKFFNKHHIHTFNIKNFNNRYLKFESPTCIQNIILNKKRYNIKYKSYKRKYNNNTYKNKTKIIIKNINKYNATENQIDINIINSLIKGKITHEKALLKDYNILNNFSENFKRYYKYREIIKIIPNFFDYYKNYFKFFLKPTLSDFYHLNLLKNNGDKQAECFYEEYKENKEKINKNTKNYNRYKKLFLSSIIEKNENSSNLLKEDSIKLKNNNSSDFSYTSLLSIINIIDNNINIRQNKIEKENDFLHKKVNLSRNSKKDDKNKNKNNKCQKSTTVFTSDNNHSIKLINEYKSVLIPKIKKKEDYINNLNTFSKNKNNVMNLTERTSIERILLKNEFSKKHSLIQKNSKTSMNNDLISSMKIKYNYTNDDNINNNVKISSYTRKNKDLYQLTTQITNRRIDIDNRYINNFNYSSNQTQINKIIKKSPLFRNDNLNRIKSTNIIYNNSKSNNIITKINNKYRNNSFRKSFIYYQKLKNENKQNI